MKNKKKIEPISYDEEGNMIIKLAARKVIRKGKILIKENSVSFDKGLSSFEAIK